MFLNFRVTHVQGLFLDHPVLDKYLKLLVFLEIVHLAAVDMHSSVLVAINYIMRGTGEQGRRRWCSQAATKLNRFSSARESLENSPRCSIGEIIKQINLFVY